MLIFASKAADAHTIDWKIEKSKRSLYNSCRPRVCYIYIQTARMRQDRSLINVSIVCARSLYRHSAALHRALFVFN